MSDIIKFISGLALAFVMGFGSGWAVKASRFTADVNETKMVAAEQALEKEREIVYVTQEVVKEVEKVKTIYRDVIKYQDKEVIKYVQSPDASLDFGVGPEWVRLFNASSLACDPTSDTCSTRSEVSGHVTRAEALEIALEQHRLYHQCRINNNGLIDFYKRVRETVNKGETNEYNRGTTADDSGEPKSG